MIGWLEGHMLPCAYKSLFGIDCPGCGFQRSCIALLKGNLSHSLALYPATIPILITAFFLLADSRLHFTHSKQIKKALYIGISVIVVVSYTYKMYRLAMGYSIAA
jgi:hypothetical protein